MHWLLAYTKPRAEVLAQQHLERQGFEVLCPLMRAQKLRRRKWTWIEEPLFPRYLFDGASAEQSWARVRSTVGVTSLVKFGGTYATVPEALIELLRSGAEQPEVHRPLFSRARSCASSRGPTPASRPSSRWKRAMSALRSCSIS